MTDDQREIDHLRASLTALSAEKERLENESKEWATREDAYSGASEASAAKAPSTHVLRGMAREAKRQLADVITRGLLSRNSVEIDRDAMAVLVPLAVSAHALGLAEVSRRLQQVTAALEKITERHDWQLGLGQCICEAHVEARKLLAQS